MPKVSDAHRESRRDQILDAAVACFLRRGVRATTMAEIIAESELSAGAIYGYFEGKQELAVAVMRREVASRREELEALSESATVRPPQVIRMIAGSIAGKAATPSLVVQMWGEAASDTDFEQIAAAAFAEVRDLHSTHLTRWLETSRGLGREEAEQQAQLLLPVLLSLVQGFILQLALVPGFDEGGYLDGVELLFGGAEREGAVAEA